MSGLKRTSLYEEHVRLGGRMVDFGGWELPVQYTGVMDEHLGCRNSVGLFDVSHMGEIHAEGPDAEKFLDLLVSNDVTKIQIGQAQYSVMCNESGGIVDDLIIYRRAPDRYLVVVNASNTEKDYEWMLRVHQKFPLNIQLENRSSEYAQIAVQGRNAEKLVQMLTPSPLNGIKNYWFTEGTLLKDIPAIIARTGYTGEDGFELYVPWKSGPLLWRALMEKGETFGIKPCGLGARDTLRLEVKFPLYGNELGDDTNPLEAGLGWVTKLEKSKFIGKEPISAKKLAGLKRKLVGIEIRGAGIPRHGYKLFTDDGASEIGVITSGTQSPSLKKPIALGYVPIEQASLGQKITVEIRGQKIPAEIVSTPFYKRPY